MIRLLTAVFLFASFHAVAEVTLTPLNNNTPADADDVMGNFNALNEALPPSNCSADQIIKWNGSAWVCSNDPLVGLNCQEGDRLMYGVSGWQCSNSYSVSFTLSGLKEGVDATFDLNGRPMTVSSNGLFHFPNQVELGQEYVVSISEGDVEPLIQHCAVTDGTAPPAVSISGVAVGPVNDITASCNEKSAIVSAEVYPGDIDNLGWDSFDIVTPLIDTTKTCNRDRCIFDIGYPAMDCDFSVPSNAVGLVRVDQYFAYVNGDPLYQYEYWIVRDLGAVEDTYGQGNLVNFRFDISC